MTIRGRACYICGAEFLDHNKVVEYVLDGKPRLVHPRCKGNHMEIVRDLEQYNGYYSL